MSQRSERGAGHARPARAGVASPAPALGRPALGGPARVVRAVVPPPARRRAGAIALAVAGALSGAVPGARLAAQARPAPPARGDTTRARADSARVDSARVDSARVRAARADTSRIDSARVQRARADTLRGSTAADSSARDSVVAQQLRTRGETVSPLTRRFNLDRLRLTSMGLTVGGAWPARVNPTRLYSVHADYGEITPGVRVVFVVSYWQSHYEDAEVRRYERAVREAVRDPAGDDTVRFGRVRSSDIALALDLRLRPGALRRWRGPASRVRPFVSTGFALHFLNAEGRPISGTFIEQALDGVAVGITGGAGLDLSLLPNFQLTMHGRYDMFNGAHFPSLRAGGSWVLDAGALRARVGDAVRRGA